MDIKKLKEAEIVDGVRLGHPDETVSKGLVGSELRVTVETENVRVMVDAADAAFFARGLRVFEAIVGQPKSFSPFDSMPMPMRTDR